MTGLVETDPKLVDELTTYLFKRFDEDNSHDIDQQEFIDVSLKDRQLLDIFCSISQGSKDMMLSEADNKIDELIG